MSPPDSVEPDLSPGHVAVFGPLAADNPVELIVQRMKAAIGVGIFGHDDLLPSEPEMAEQFHTTVFSTREALARLREDGLIVTRRGRNGGSRVNLVPTQATHILDERLRDLSGADLRDVGDWRSMLSAEEARLAASRASSRNIDRLASFVRRLGDAPSIPSVAASMGRLQMELAAAAQSPKMSGAEVDFHAEHGWLVVAGLADPDCRRATVDDLNTMVRAIEARNEARARSSAEVYVRRLFYAIQERRLMAVKSA